MALRPFGISCAALTTLALAGAAGAQTPVSVGDVQFLDRAARGEITLGNIRGSIGVIDYDQDGWPDLFINDNQGLPKRLFHNVPSPSTPGGRTFVDVSAASGIGTNADATSRASGGVVILDYNNDGWPDIYSAGGGSGGAGTLLRNNADGTFTNVTASSGVRVSGINPLCASAIDFDHDGFIDLLLPSSGTPGRTLTLLRNNGDGTFTSRPDLLPEVSFSGTTYAMIFTDYDHDGWEDALVCLNNGIPLTLKNVPNPAGGRMFIDATGASGFTRVGPAPMGIATGDFDGDGWLDVAITDAVRGTYYKNNNGTLTQIFPFATFFGWGTTWLDAENDGDLDNYQAGSAGASNIDFIFRNDNGAWTDARAALNTTALPSQYCARVDFDNDGREDLITVNVGQFISVYHNQSVSGHWAKFRLVGERGVNRDAAGAIVRLSAGGKTQVREIALGSSYGAGEDLRAHFGLGAATTIDRVEVIWPRAGTLSERTEVYPGPFAADTIYTLRPRAGCVADLADASGFGPPDGKLTGADVIAFFQDFFADCASGAVPCGRADLTDGSGSGPADGRLTGADVIVFFKSFFAGCGQ